MRIRPLAALSVAALSAVLLAGCAGTGDPDATPSPTASAATDLCSAAVDSGDASDAVTVEGEIGTPSTATFTAPLTVDELQRTVIDEGEGEPLAAGDYVQFAMSAFDAETGEQVGTLGYTAGELLPQQISPESAVGQIVGCAAPGSRFVAAFPATDSNTAQVYIFDVIAKTPLAAWGEPQTPAEGLPTVELDDDGAPTITVPDDLATPDTTEVEVLKKGDGETVAAGDTVLVQYTGVLTDGTVFDSSWDRGAPAQFQTTGVVTGFAKALEGQTVGSQVLAVIPAAEGYGDAEQGSIPANSTLIFVVDILATQHAAQ